MLDGFAGALIAAGIALSAAKDSIGGLSPWLNVALIVAGALTELLARGLAWLQGQKREEQARAQLLRVRRQISEVDPFEEGLVFSSALAERATIAGERPPYVDRDVDRAVDEALRSRPFVLITGAAKAGKSRTAFEAVQRMVPEPTLLVPRSAEALPNLLDPDNFPDLGSHCAVLWLDNLDLYLGAKGLDSAHSVDRLKALARATPRVVVAATITLTAYDRLSGTGGEIGKRALDVLEYARSGEITLASELSPAEKERALAAYPRERFDAGIGEHFAAGRALVDRFKTALEARPHGFAIVLAALDWRRAGMSRPIGEPELKAFYAVCLKRFHPLARPGEEEYKQGLEWASKPLETRAALLMFEGDDNGAGGFAIFDFVRDWSDGSGSDVDARLRALPDETWRFVIENATPDELLSVAFTAHSRGSTAAVDAYQRAIDSGHADAAPWAAVHLGNLLRDQSQLEEAAEAYRRAIESGHASAAPWATAHLGNVLKEQGRLEEAVEAYRRAIDSGHADAAPWAASDLGDLLKQQGKLGEAAEAYRRAIESGQADAAPWAMAHLGDVLKEQGKLDEAAEAYRRAIDSGHDAAAPWSVAYLGNVLRLQEKPDEAAEAYRSAMESGHADAAPWAAVYLGQLLKEEGRLGKAAGAYRRAIDSAHINAAPWAALYLGKLLRGQGKLEQAVEAYRRAIDSGHADAAPWAASDLGDLLNEQGKLEQAAAAYRRAIDSGHAGAASTATAKLEQLRRRSQSL
ncbi:MAG: tetratricopeptide repeat protein [Gaiellaceae bacterium]